MNSINYSLKLFFLLLFISINNVLFAQYHFHDRTPKEIAMKQTEMMVRELNITDSIQRDTIFRLHLKYAILHSKSHTRYDELNYFQAYNIELRGILTSAQYNKFMSRQINHQPHHQQLPTSRMVTPGTPPLDRPLPPNDATRRTQQQTMSPQQ